MHSITARVARPGQAFLLLLIVLGLALGGLAFSAVGGPLGVATAHASDDDGDDNQGHEDDEGDDEGDDDEGEDRRAGAVFAATNAPSGNQVFAYRRAANGRLTRTGTFSTGGTGSGAFEQVANTLILGGSNQSSPTDLGGSARLLFVTNTTSNSITVFRRRGSDLEKVELEPSNGTNPTSLTLHHNVLYVLNGGGPGCTGGNPNISGFRVSDQGQLTPIPNSTRPVSGGANSGCAHVSFDQKGEVLSVTQRQADRIDTYRVGDDDRPTGPIVNETSGLGPFGLTITKRNQLLTAENFGGVQLQGAVAPYRINDDASLTPISPSVRNFRSDTCWIELTDNNRFGFATNAMSGDISSYRINRDGSLVLLESIAANIGLIGADEATVGNRLLYARSGAPTGTIHVFRITETGRLIRVQDVTDGLPPFGAIGMAAV